MKFIIKGDKNQNYNGKFVAEFEDDNKKIHKLYFDLEKWENPANNGFFGGNYLQIVHPKPMNLAFEQYYEFDIENTRLVYEILCQHGWSINK